MDTGTRLKLVRERNNLSQRELARRSGLTNSTISQIEQNRVSPSVSSLKKLLEGIPMSLAEFFSFDEPVREERYVFRGGEQPDLGRNGLRMLLVGATVSALGFASGALATTAPWLWACYFVAAAGMGFVFPAFSALAANAMQAGAQGATAGSIGAAQGMGAVIGPLAGTLVYAVDPRLPFLAVATLLLLVGLWPIPREQRR